MTIEPTRILILTILLLLGIFYVMPQVSRLSKRSSTPVSPPPGSDLEQAKQIYTRYGCNLYHLWHDEGNEAHEHYESLGATPAHEAEWRMEYIQQHLEKLKTEGMSLKLGSTLTTASAVEALPSLLAHLPKGDSYEQLWCAHTIIHLVDGERRGRSNLALLNHIPSDDHFLPAELPPLKTCLETLRHIVDGPITLSDAHLEEVQNFPIPSNLPKDAENYIRERAKSELDAVKALLDG